MEILQGTTLRVVNWILASENNTLACKSLAWRNSLKSVFTFQNKTLRIICICHLEYLISVFWAFQMKSLFTVWKQTQDTMLAAMQRTPPCLKSTILARCFLGLVPVVLNPSWTDEINIFNMCLQLLRFCPVLLVSLWKLWHRSGCRPSNSHDLVVRLTNSGLISQSHNLISKSHGFPQWITASIRASLYTSNICMYN